MPQFAPARRPDRGERQEIALAIAVGELGLDDLREENLGCGAFRRRPVDLAMSQHAQRCNTLILCRKPPLARQEGRDHIAFELRQIVPTK